MFRCLRTAADEIKRKDVRPFILGVTNTNTNLNQFVRSGAVVSELLSANISTPLFDETLVNTISCVQIPSQ